MQVLCLGETVMTSLIPSGINDEMLEAMLLRTLGRKLRYKWSYQKLQWIRCDYI